MSAECILDVVEGHSACASSHCVFNRKALQPEASSSTTVHNSNVTQSSHRERLTVHSFLFEKDEGSKPLTNSHMAFALCPRTTTLTTLSNTLSRTPGPEQSRCLSTLTLTARRRPLLSISESRPSTAEIGSKTRVMSSSSAKSRLSLISRHLQPASSIPLNTPYSAAERATQAPAGPKQSIDGSSFSTKTPATSQTPMSSQAPHATVLIPGPIEYDDAVLQSMSHYRYVASVGDPNVVL